MIILILGILAFAISAFAIAVSHIKLEKKKELTDEIFYRNVENAKRIYHTEESLSLREAEIRKKENLYKNLEKITINYAVSNSDYYKYVTKEKIHRYAKEYIAKQIMNDADFYKQIKCTKNSLGDSLYTFTYYVLAQKEDNQSPSD